MRGAPSDARQGSRMYESSFHLNADFVSELWHRLHEDEEERNRQLFTGMPAAASAVPSTAHLERMIEGAFWASLKKVEGREVSFVLAYIEPEDGDSSFIFKSRVPFTPDGLALKGRCDPGNSRRLRQDFGCRLSFKRVSFARSLCPSPSRDTAS